MSKYFYDNEAEQYLFFRIPQMLFTEKKFKKLSCEARVLYGLLLDRAGLSRKNKWFDKEGRLYIYYKQEEVCEQLSIGKDKVIKIFTELETIGLIYRKKQGLGKPIRIYVLNFVKVADDDKEDINSSDTETKHQSKMTSNKNQDFGKSEIQTSEKQKSGVRKNRSQDFEKTETNHTEYNHTEYNHTEYQSNQSNLPEQQTNSFVNNKTDMNDRIDGWSDDERNAYLLYVKENIDYDYCSDVLKIDESFLNLVVQIILETYNPCIRYIVINGQSYNKIVIQKKFEQLDSSHIQYVRECLKETMKTQKIKDLRKYLKTCLFNAPDTIDLYYDNQVAYDMQNIHTKQNNQKTEDAKYKSSYDLQFLEGIGLLD